MRFTIRFCLLGAVFMCITHMGHAQAKVNCSSTDKVINCRIDQPTVTQRRTTYSAIQFRPGDKILVNAGGCVQTGGSGSTWKRFVNPQGDNSDRLYHGLISIPGRTEQRIQGVVNQTITLPSVIPPAEANLVIGYEDDNYGDNGYWGHDDGTGDQCKEGPGRDGGPAWVTIRIDRTGGTTTGHPSPFDIIGNNFDQNGLPLNPSWQWEKDHPGTHPDPQALCSGFPYINSSDTSLGVTFGNPPCTTQAPSLNVPNGFNDILCNSRSTPGHLHGHLNWWVATVNGKIFWHDHTDWTQTGDDDYDFRLTPTVATGLTTANPNDVPNQAQSYEIEFDSDETVDNIDRGWWNDFHKAVDSNDGHTGGPAGALIDGHDAIVIGLLGLDSEHGAYTELHPIYGVAIHVKDDPKDDTWALLFRNWGDEGFCSQDEMAAPLTTMTFFLPRPGATGGTANTDQIFSNNGNTISVTTQRGGAVVTVDLGQPESQALVHGAIHLNWTMGAPGAPPPPARLIAPGPIVAQRITHEENGPEAAAAQLMAQVPPAKKAELQAKLRKTPKPPFAKPVRRVAQINVVHVTGPVKPRKLPATAKIARDKLRHDALCTAFSGQIPGYPASVCQATR